MRLGPVLALVMTFGSVAPAMAQSKVIDLSPAPAPAAPPASAPAKPAPPAPPPPASTPAPAPPEERVGTDKAPLVVRIAPSPDTQSENDEQRRVANWTIGLTIALVGATILQFLALWYQGYWVRRSVRVAERALTELERPVVYAAVTKPGFEFAGGFSSTELELSVFNAGRTLAILTRINYAVSCAPSGGITGPIDPFAIGGRGLPPCILVTSTEPYQERVNLRLRFVAEGPEIYQGRLSIWLVGFVRYDDIFGNHYIAGFTQVYDPVGRRFIYRGDTTYNYSRREDDDQIPAPSSE